MKTSALFTLASVVSSVLAACDPPTARISLAKKGLNPNGNVGAAYCPSFVKVSFRFARINNQLRSYEQ